MPAKSKAQFRFMAAVASGKARNKPEGLSKQEAKEFLEGVRYAKLPEKAKKKGK